MALTVIQTEKWRQQIDAFLTTMTVASQICDVAIPIEGTDTFHIISFSDITTANVNDAADITYNALTDSDNTVTKNFDKQFSLLILDTNKMQTTIQGWEQAAAGNGAYQLAADLDTAVLANHANAGSNFQEAGSAWQFTVTTCADIPSFFAKLEKALRDNKVDNLGMPYVVGPTGFGEAIQTYTGGRATDFGDQVLLAGGARAFTYSGFRVFISNNCDSSGGTTHGLAGILGYGYALGTYVTPETEVMRAEGRWGDLIRGRVAAGYKIYRGDAVIDVEFNDTTVATS